jgi:hypothetical protein
MIRMLHLADLITELNGPFFFSSPSPSPLFNTLHFTNVLNGLGFCGVMSIFSSMRYCLGPPSAQANLWAALAFMPFGLFFDFMDGKVARWRKKSSLMGQELDSLADLVSLDHFTSSITTRGRIVANKRIHRSPSVSPPQPAPSQLVSALPSTTSSSPSSSSAVSPVSLASTLLSPTFQKMLLENLNILKALPSRLA